MSYSVNLQTLPREVLREIFTPENMRGRTSVSSLTQLSFPKTRSALWDGSPAGDKLRLHLCSHRKLRVLLLEKALRLAQRHARHSNKPRLLFFFLGSLSVDPDEEGVVVTLDRFDPGRDQAGASGRVPSALLPGDVLVPCLFSSQPEATPDSVVQSEAEIHLCFKTLQQFVSSRQTLDLSQLLKIRAGIVCSQQSDAAAFSLSWSAICLAVSVDVQPVRAVPIIPTALLRSLTSISRSPQSSSRQRGFLTMDQTRKLVLLLESDPKASSLPLVGLWLSGITHVYNPQVWSWTLRFIFSSTLKDRVLSESGCFLLVMFGSTHRAPQFFQCRGSGLGPGPGPQLDFQQLTGYQSVTLYQKVATDGRSLQCELHSEDQSRQAEVFRAAQSSFSSSPPPAAGFSVGDQDSGVEDEDFSPRPSPSPHPPAPQTRRLQPSVPELSLLIDSSFTFSHSNGQDSSHRPPPAPPGSGTGSSAAPPPPPHHHSTPNSNLQQPCTCCSTQTYDCTSIFPSPAPLPAVALPPSCQNTPLLPSFHPPPPPPSSHHKPPHGPHPSPPSIHPAPPPSSSHHKPPGSPHPSPPSIHPAPPPFSHHKPPHGPYPSPASIHPAPPPPSSHHKPPDSPHPSPPSIHPAPPPPSSHHKPPHGPYPSPASIHPAPPPPSSHHTPPDNPHPSPPSIHPAPPPPYSHHKPPSSPHPSPPSIHPAPPPSSHHKLPPTPRPPPLCSSHQYHLPSGSSPPLPSTYNSPPPPLHPSTSTSTHHHTPPPPSSRLSAPPCPYSHPLHPALPWCGDSPSPHPLHPPSGDPVCPPWLPRPPCLNRCCDQAGGAMPSDTYQLLLHQDQQLRLLQAQVQMLLEAQGKLQSSSRQVDTQTSRSTASIAVETGASLFWGTDPMQPPSHQEEQAPHPSPPRPPPSSSSSPSTSSHDLSVRRPVGGDEDGDITEQVAPGSPPASGQHGISGLQSPVLGESVSMYEPPDQEQNFYHDLMTQLSSRLQESDSKQDGEEESRRRSLSVSDHAQSSQSSSSSFSKRKQDQRCVEGDPVVRATLQQLQQLGVDLDETDVTESEKDRLRAVESASTLASINPAAVVSRLSVSELTASALFPGGSVDLSLEANAIALRYLSDSQLSRLSLGGHAPRHVPTQPTPSTSRDSLLSPSNMSLATRKYMRKYGLIEEEEEEEEEVRVQEASARQPLTVKLLPQSQLIRDLRPKMQLLVAGSKPNGTDKENCSSRRTSAVQTGSCQPEGSLGNILDLSRLRQLPKLF